jgi:UDP-2-acetamido-3-amino-2,3-dideoxy-glucuronate N-acetyltransferase
VKKSASIGANATIVCGVTIGEYALVGAGSVVTRDVSAYALVYGNPARVQGRVNPEGCKLDKGTDSD